MSNLPPGVHFFSGNGGLRSLRVATPRVEAEVYLQGATVTHFQPTGQRPVLFLSGKSYFEAGKPIRGGVPICFPWFGAREAGKPGAPHGFARLHEWRLAKAEARPDEKIELTLQLDANDVTRQLWASEMDVTYRVLVGESLKLSLEVTNRSTAAFSFEEALHTYFSVSDIKDVQVEGLAGTSYLDHLKAGQECSETNPAIRFTAETDRNYFNTRATSIVQDPGWKRRLIVEKENSLNTVVWNPWVAKSAAMPDFGDDEWPGMVCVETCNIRAQRIQLLPGQSHTLIASIRAEPLS